MSGLRLLLVVLTTALAVGGLAGPSAARVYDDAPLAWRWVPNGTVEDIAVRGTHVFLAGEFTQLRNVNTGEVVARRGLAKLTTGGALVRHWNPRANASVHALAFNRRGTALYVGGNFTRIDGVRRSRVAALTTGRGALIGGWKARVNDTVFDLALRGRRLFIAGDFTKVDGVSRRRLAALSRGSADLVRDFRANANGRVRALDLRRKTLLLGGNFTRVRGLPRTYLASVGAGSGRLTSWRPQPVCDTCTVFDVDVVRTRAYAAIGGENGGRLAGYNSFNGQRLWVVQTNGDVQAVKVSGNRVYAGGHFETTFGGQPRTLLAAVYRSRGGVVPDFAPTLTADRPGVNAIAVTSSRLFAAGGFDKGTTPENVAAFRAVN